VSHFITPEAIVHSPARSIRTAAERARVVWPWVATFALATTLAMAVDHSIAGAQVAPMQAQSADAIATLPASSTHTIILTSTNPQGVTQSVVCDAPPNLFASDVLELSPIDLTRLSSQLQCDKARPVASADTPAGVGVMSISSPASTGHASPHGCCTWD
jgi:hypothetical protein